MSAGYRVSLTTDPPCAVFLYRCSRIADRALPKYIGRVFYFWAKLCKLLILIGLQNYSIAKVSDFENSSCLYISERAQGVGANPLIIKRYSEELIS